MTLSKTCLFANLAEHLRILIDQTHFMSVLAVCAHCLVIRTSLGKLCPIFGFPQLNCNFDKKVNCCIDFLRFGSNSWKPYNFCRIRQNRAKIQKTGLYVHFVLIGHRKPPKNPRGNFEELRGTFEEASRSFEEASSSQNPPNL